MHGEHSLINVHKQHREIIYLRKSFTISLIKNIFQIHFLFLSVGLVSESFPHLRIFTTVGNFLVWVEGGLVNNKK